MLVSYKDGLTGFGARAALVSKKIAFFKKYYPLRAKNVATGGIVVKVPPINWQASAEVHLHCSYLISSPCPGLFAIFSIFSVSL